MLIQIQGSHNLDSILICKLTGTGSFPDSFSTVIRPLGKQPQTSHSTIVYVGNLQAFEDCLRGFRKVGFTNEKLQKHELFWRWITEHDGSSWDNSVFGPAACISGGG